MVLIAVTGSACRSLPAERGTAQVRAAAEAAVQQDAVDAVLATHARLVRDAQELVDSGAASRWSAPQVRVEVRRDFEASGEVRITHHAWATVRVRFRDFDALSAWVARIGADGAAVDGVEWSVTRASRERAERELRIEAVQDASARAADYAAAIGADGVLLQQLWEPGLRPQDSGGAWAARAMDGSQGEGFSLRPEPVEVQAAVTADFTTR